MPTRPIESITSQEAKSIIVDTLAWLEDHPEQHTYGAFTRNRDGTIIDIESADPETDCYCFVGRAERMAHDRGFVHLRSPTKAMRNILEVGFPWTSAGSLTATNDYALMANPKNTKGSITQLRRVLGLLETDNG